MFVRYNSISCDVETMEIQDKKDDSFRALSMPIDVSQRNPETHDTRAISINRQFPFLRRSELMTVQTNIGARLIKLGGFTAFDNGVKFVGGTLTS